MDSNTDQNIPMLRRSRNIELQEEFGDLAYAVGIPVAQIGIPVAQVTWSKYWERITSIPCNAHVSIGELSETEFDCVNDIFRINNESVSVDILVFGQKIE